MSDATNKSFLGVNVLEAARDRISMAFDESERVCVSFSGGKDSTVLLHLVMDEAIDRARRVGVMFVDLEGQYRLTVAHVHRCLELYSDHIDGYWIALPLTLRNAVSQYEPHWMCWEPGREESWIRQPPDRAITNEDRLPFFRRGMEFEQFVPNFNEWYADGRSTAIFVGIRTQESLNRWRSLASKTKRTVRGWRWTTWKGDYTWNAYPIYDWSTEDVWTYHARHPDRPYNALYDRMHAAGMTIHQARICQPYGDDQRRGLWLWHVIEPESWARVVARVNGANHGARYAREPGNILGQQKVTRPEGHSWESFTRMMLTSMPEKTAEHYRNKIAVFLKWWAHRGHEHGIPDEADPELEAARDAPSWRRIAKTILRNDYWCKGLSFSVPKDPSSSYARYISIMRKKRNEWGVMTGPGVRWERLCGVDVPGRPTAKQLALIASLTGKCSPQQAYEVLGSELGMSASAARRRATREEASRAIEAIRENEAEYRQEKLAPWT